MIQSVLSPRLQQSLHKTSFGEVLITAKCPQLGDKLRRQGFEAEDLSLIPAVVAKVSNRQIARLAMRKDVGYIQDNVKVRALLDIARGTVGVSSPSVYSGEGITIAILDTGISPHPDFGDRIIAFHDVINDRTEPYDDNGHGTMCAGCAAGDGYVSGGIFQGLAPKAKMVGVKAMNAQGDGTLIDVLRGMQWVSANRAKYNIQVLSLSLGVEMLDILDPLAKAAEALWAQGIVVVAAAGNSGPKAGTINSPGRASSIVTVGAMDDRSQSWFVPEFSSRGPVRGTKKPDVCAPGVRISTTKGDTYAPFTGTSASTPVVAGCAALLLQQHPDWSPVKIKEYLLAHAKPIGSDWDAEGAGVVHVQEVDEDPIDRRWLYQ